MNSFLQQGFANPAGVRLEKMHSGVTAGCKPSTKPHRHSSKVLLDLENQARHTGSLAGFEMTMCR
jgi:hypothetical protein